MFDIVWEVRRGWKGNVGLRNPVPMNGVKNNQMENDGNEPRNPTGLLVSALVYPIPRNYCRYQPLLKLKTEQPKEGPRICVPSSIT